MSDLRSGIDKVFLKENIYKVKTYAERVIDNKGIFLAFRDGKYTFYYYGYVLLYLEIKNGEVTLITRNFFENNNELNKKYKEFMKTIPRIRDYGKTNDIIDGNKYFFEKNRYELPESYFRGYSIEKLMKYLFDNLKKLLEERFNLKETGERAIQNKYTTEYSLKDEIYIVDMELCLPKYLKAKLKKRNIKGRYDMVALHNCDGKYKLVFIELKSAKGACRGDSGINNHISDMRDFLKEYNSNGVLKEEISKFVKNTLDNKRELKLLNYSSIEIDFEYPEFWLLFDMQDGTDCSSIEAIEKVINEKIIDIDKDYLKIYNGNIHRNKKELKCIKK